MPRNAVPAVSVMFTVLLVTVAVNVGSDKASGVLTKIGSARPFTGSLKVVMVLLSNRMFEVALSPSVLLGNAISVRLVGYGPPEAPTTMLLLLTTAVMFAADVAFSATCPTR